MTQTQYEMVMGQNPSEHKGAHRPVENVSWDEVSEFCRRLTALARETGALTGSDEFRLPTEAEWEYACRAGTTSAFNDGSDCSKPVGKDPALERLGWYGKNSGKETHPVGEKAPNAWGLYDMHGNVWEWCLDGRREYTNESQADPLGPLDGAGRVIRGCCFWFDAGGCRSASRAGTGRASASIPLASASPQVCRHRAEHGSIKLDDIKILKNQYSRQMYIYKRRPRYDSCKRRSSSPPR